MTALRSSSMRALSPHRSTLLASLSHQEALTPHCTCRQQVISSHQHASDSHHTGYSAAFHSSCPQSSSDPQSIYVQSKRAFRKVPSEQKFGLDKGKGPQKQSIRRVLQQVHMSSWAKSTLGSIFNGMGSFAVSTPSRLAEEVNRLVGRNSKKAETQLVGNEKVQEEVVVPAENATVTKNSISKVVQLPEVHINREQHTLEQSFEDANQGFSSVFHVYTLPKDMPVSSKKVPQPEEDTWNMFRKIPFSFTENTQTTTSVKKKPLIRKDFVSRSAVEGRTKALVSSLKSAMSYSSKLMRTQDLCKHLKQYPSGRHDATELKVVPILIQMAESGEKELVEEAREALALLGYTVPVKGRGIRILSLDGGGTRGLMTIQCLKKIESISGCKISELFDYVCGVSTGALIAAMACLYRLPLEKCEQLYLEFSRQMFSRSRVMGTGGLMWNHAFYNSDQWEEILKKEIGHRTMIEFSRDPLVPKISAISSLMNTPRMKNFVFRNYNLPPSTYSHYPGACTHELWQVIRASSAAPGYYEDFPLGDYIHSDGGLSTNNPSALAIHESRLLWPNEAIQCVVSLGTGRYEPTMELTGKSINSRVSLKEKVNKIVDSATDTESVHVMMTDLMPPGTYFRFNPYLSEDLQLDEIRQGHLDIMQRDTIMYLRKNERKMQKLVDTLKQSRMAHQHMMDWIKRKADGFQ